jgi:predicted O-linked N-acetylglucosamine transferase (SPINDLY family)
MLRDKESEAALRFTDCLRRAVARELSASELIAAAEEVSSGGERDLVPQLYQAWLARNPDDPLRHAVQFNLAVAQAEAGDLAGARDAFVEAIRSNPDFLPPYINLGVLLERGGHIEQAVTSWMGAVNRVPAVTGDAVTHKAAALKQLGRVFENAQDAPTAEDFLHKSLDIDPHQRDVAQHWIALRQAQCKWPVVTGWGGVTRKLLLGAISPLSLAVHSDDPIFQLGNAHRYYRMEVAPASIATVGAWPAPQEGARRRLRIGYVSSDLREHAVGFLTAELFELHDKARVEVFAYYCGTPPKDALSARIEAAVDRWTDISSMSDTDAAARIVADRIDILVDLNGYTKDARPKLFALRPAPVIVNWLGYPGTMGSPHHHYIIADDFIIPPELEHLYSEKVLRLPCYQPNDRRRVVAERRASRAEAGLPESAFVYCCFNGTQKISRFTFARWMEILRRVENSVLWLLSGGPAAEAALRRHAEAHRVAPERLVFAPKKTNPEHLARIGLADLFLERSGWACRC